MSARFNRISPTSSSDIAYLIRKSLRYRFAELMLQQEFDQALAEAETAWKQNNILPDDYQFVQEIVQTAQKLKPSWSLSAEEITTSHPDLPLSASRPNNL